MKSGGYVVTDWQSLIASYAANKQAALIVSQPTLDDLPYIDFTGAEVHGHKVIRCVDRYGRRWKVQCGCGAQIERPYLKVFKAALDFRYQKYADIGRKISCAECLKSKKEVSAAKELER